MVNALESYMVHDDSFLARAMRLWNLEKAGLEHLLCIYFCNSQYLAPLYSLISKAAWTAAKRWGQHAFNGFQVPDAKTCPPLTSRPDVAASQRTNRNELLNHKTVEDDELYCAN